MNNHLSEQGVFMYLIGDISIEERQHAEECAACQAKIADLATPLTHFRGAVRSWSDRASVKDRASELRWTVIASSDHLERLLLPVSLDIPWYRSLWNNINESLKPQIPLMDLTSKPVLVQDIWGQYGRQKKSWVMSVALQSAVVVLLFAAASTKTVQQKVAHFIPLLDPNLSAYEPKQQRAKDTMAGGGGGGDHSPLPASKGRLPKPALRQFTPPTALALNANPKLTMEPTIIAPPDTRLPEVNIYGKGAIVGSAGELEHGALWHVPGGCAMREVLGGAKAIVSSAKKVGAPSTKLDVPITHINASYVRSHFDAMEIYVPGAPASDELVYVLVMTTGARVHERVGGLRAGEIKGTDGLR